MIELRPFDLGNAKTHFRWNNDEELNFYDSDYPHRKESFTDFVGRLERVTADDNFANRLLEIHVTDTKELIGVVDIFRIDHYNKRCYIECSIGDKKYRKKGYGEAALRKALTICFTDMGMNKVTTTAFDFNEGWSALVQKVGFTKEGVLRKHTLKQDTYRDKLVFGLLREEYEAQYANVYQEAAPC